MILKLSNNQTANLQTVDLSPYVDVQEGDGLDLADPQFTSKVWGRSLLKPGATLALTQFTEKELVFPLLLGPIGGQSLSNLPAVLQFVTSINQIGETPGCVLEWQPDGASQPTYFDGLGAQADIDYSYRKEGQGWTKVTLRFFCAPFGRTAGPRPYAAASGVGPLLLISPYASGGANILTASGIGFGASPQKGPVGASSGISYWGSPSLAGDAPTALQVSYVGPLPNTATNLGLTPYVAMSVLPDRYYRPLITTAEIAAVNATTVRSTTAIASQYLSVFTGADRMVFSPIPNQLLQTTGGPAQNYVGEHRLFAIARASNGAGTLQTQQNLYVSYPTTATVTSIDWQPYDLGTFTLRPSQYAANIGITIAVNHPHLPGALDVAGLVMLPDNSTWFLAPQSLQPSQLGWPNSTAVYTAGINYTNTFLLDDVIGDQFMYYGQSQTSAPSPLAGAGTINGTLLQSTLITPYTRGLVPTPDPKNGLPIIAIFSVAQNYTPSTTYVDIGGIEPVPGGSWANPLNLRTMAQVNVLERARYILP